MKPLSVPQAEKIISNTKVLSRTTSVAIIDACGKILTENIIADRDQPASDRSSMDGITISFAAWQKGCREFHIEGVQKAGIAAKKRKKLTGCFEIMTGAVIPQGCDTVIPIESVKIFGKQALVYSQSSVQQFRFIRKRGSEYKKGRVLVSPGTILNPTHLSVAASVGKTKLKVLSSRIAVIGTGDELVELNKKPKVYQARRSNAYTLEATFRRHGFNEVNRFHLRDHAAQLEKGLKRILSKHDVVVLSGGVSMGKFDLIPGVLKKLGAKIIFHKVSQRPGKPLLFARRGEKVIFGLPGNPVSTLICAVRYVVPFLQRKTNFTTIPLSAAVKQNPDLTLFLPVKGTIKGSVPISFAGSGDYGALTNSDGFVEIPAGHGTWKKGREAKFFAW